MKTQIIKSTSILLNLIMVISIMYVTQSMAGMTGQEIGIQRALLEAQQSN